MAEKITNPARMLVAEFARETINVSLEEEHKKTRVTFEFVHLFCRRLYMQSNVQIGHTEYQISNMVRRGTGLCLLATLQGNHISATLSSVPGVPHELGLHDWLLLGCNQALV